MAVVGVANIAVRAITTGVARDIAKGFRDSDRIGQKVGKSTGSNFYKGFGKGDGIFKKLSSAFSSMSARSEGTRKAWVKLQKSGFALQTAVGVLAGSLGAVVGGLGALIGAAGGAASAGVALVGTFVSLKIAAMAAKFALSGVGAAVSALWKQQGKSDKANKAAARQIRDARRALAKVIEQNAENLVEANKRIEKAQLDLNKAFKEGQEEVQQLGFDAEDAALNEKKAALELERARETLLRVQDLPPNSRARREAELAFQEAELNYRRAIDQNADLAAEQQRIAGDPKNTEGYIDAAQEVADAEADKAKTVRDGIRDEIEARERLTEAIEDSKTAATGGTDPLAGLTESQQKFALYLASLRPLLDGLKEAVAKGFLPKLQEQMERIINSDLMGVIQKGAEDMGIALGKAAENFTDELLKPDNIASIAQVIETASYVTEKFGSIAGKAFGAFVTILDAADPVIRKFVDFIDKKAGIFDNFLKTKNASGELESFFNRAGEIAAQFGDIFGNVFGFLGDVIKANFEPGSGGDIMLQYLQKATQAWSDFGKTPEGMATLQQYFKDAANNLTAMLDTLGPFVLEILKLGADPNIKIFWDTMGEGVPYLAEIMKSGVEAGPSLARLLVALTKITSVLADSGSIQIFFDTLTAVADVIAKALENDVVKSIVNTISQVAAFALALGAIAGIAGKVGAVIFATFARFGPVFGPLLFVISAIVIAMMALYQTNSEFAASVNELAGAFMSGLAEIGGAFAGLMTEMAPLLSTFIGSLVDIMMQLLPVIRDQIMPAFFGLLEAILPLIPVFMESLLPAITALIGIIVPLVALLIANLFPVLGSVLQAVVPLVAAFMDMFTAIAPLISEIFASLIPAFTQIIAALVPIILIVVEQFIPIFQSIMEAILPLIPIIIDMLVPILVQIMDAVADLMPILLDLVANIITAVMPAFIGIFNAVMPIVGALVELLIPIVKVLIAALAPLINVLVVVIGIFLNVVATILQFVMPIITVLIKIITFLANLFAEGFTGAIKLFSTVFRSVFEGVSSFFKGIMNGLISAAEGFINFFIDGINGLIRLINTIKIDVPDWVPLIGGKSFGFSLQPLAKVKLARLAEGGTVKATAGGILAQIGEAGQNERIEPLDPNGLSARDKAMIELLAGRNGNQNSVQIIVNPAPGMNERELAQAVSKQLAIQMRKGSIA